MIPKKQMWKKRQILLNYLKPQKLPMQEVLTKVEHSGAMIPKSIPSDKRQSIVGQKNLVKSYTNKEKYERNSSTMMEDELMKVITIGK